MEEWPVLPQDYSREAEAKSTGNRLTEVTLDYQQTKMGRETMWPWKWLLRLPSRKDSLRPVVRERPSTRSFGVSLPCTECLSLRAPPSGDTCIWWLSGDTRENGHAIPAPLHFLCPFLLSRLPPASADPNKHFAPKLGLSINPWKKNQLFQQSLALR